MKLERIEEFERAAQALVNPNAKPHEYLMQPYGYCPVEREITPYRGEFGPEGAFIWCFSCRNMFSNASYSSSEASYFHGDLVPQRFAKDIEKLHARENQASELLRLAREERKRLVKKREKIELELQDVTEGIQRFTAIVINTAKLS